MIALLLQQTPAGLMLETLYSLRDRLFAYLPFLALGLLVFCMFLVLARVIRRIMIELGKRTRLDVTLAKVLAGLAFLIVSILGILVAAVIIFPSFSPGNLVAGLGITSVAIGFAFKDILQNLFAGILILWRKPFRIGDQIQTQEFEGTVEEINIRSTYLQTYDGQRVVIPNGDIYTRPIVVNTAFDKRRVLFSVGIGYPDSIEEARSVIHGVLSNTKGVMAEPEPWIYVTELAPSSVNFEVYFWTEPTQANVLRVREQVATGIKLALDKAGIDIPYPHLVIQFPDKTSGPERLEKPGK